MFKFLDILLTKVIIFNIENLTEILINNNFKTFFNKFTTNLAFKLCLRHITWMRKWHFVKELF